MIQEKIQAAEYISNLTESEKRDLCESIAEDIYFLDEQLQKEIIDLLYEISPEISKHISEINSFTY